MCDSISQICHLSEKNAAMFSEKKSDYIKNNMDSRVMWYPGGEDIFSLHFSVHKVLLPICC